MHISIITVFPDLYRPFLSTSLIARAQAQGNVSFNIVAFSDVCQPKERIDEPVCGPGDGMVIKPSVVERALKRCVDAYGSGYTIFFSPQGQKLTQHTLKGLWQSFTDDASGCTKDDSSESGRSGKHLILVCPRYEGVDDRVQEEYADLVVSIGDYVLMSGDLPAQVFIESFLRLIPGVVGKKQSVEQDSFSASLLDYPTFGLPKRWHDREIPEVVFSGNHAHIDAWRNEQALKKTLVKRFDWFRSYADKPQEIAQALSCMPRHYIALMHTDVYLKGGTLGTTSIKSIDLHDISRTCATYGVTSFFPVTPLEDQHNIMHTFLDFWRSEEGKKYNPMRVASAQTIRPKTSLEQAIAAIEHETGKKPLLVATSAKKPDSADVHRCIDFSDHGTVWAHDRPVLLLFGTGYGLSKQIMSRVDYILLPVKGMPTYNHLSVRSAVAIILDRWLGLFTKKTVLELENTGK